MARAFISAAALFVKVKSKAREPGLFMRRRLVRYERTRVLPLPGPARTAIARSDDSTADRCSSSSGFFSSSWRRKEGSRGSSLDTSKYSVERRWHPRQIECLNEERCVRDFVLGDKHVHLIF